MLFPALGIAAFIPLASLQAIQEAMREPAQSPADDERSLMQKKRRIIS